MNARKILDKIVTEDFTMTGVIDTPTKKHVIFYNMTNNDNSDLSMGIIVWRSFYSNIRFSVFIAKYLPNLPYPEPICIPKKMIISPIIEEEKPSIKIVRSFTRQYQTCLTDDTMHKVS